MKNAEQVRVLFIAFAMAAALGLEGCAVIRIQTAGKDDIEVKHRFGIVSVEIKPGAGATIVESTSFGAINGFEGFVLGYRDATMAAVGREHCQLVLWIKTKDQLKELGELLIDRTDICVVRPKKGA
jgi:uncharacterized protein YceK